MLLLYFHMERGLEKKIEEKLSKYKEESFVWEGVFQKQLNEACEELESVTIEDPVSDHQILWRPLQCKRWKC
jgi:hypothetical protein